MACEVLEGLKSAEADARSRFVQFAYKENQHLWGVSKTQAACIAREEQTKMSELGNQRFVHQANCATCLENRKGSHGA